MDRLRFGVEMTLDAVIDESDETGGDDNTELLVRLWWGKVLAF